MNVFETDKPVLIYGHGKFTTYHDDRGNLFYVSQGDRNYTLPPGKYRVTGDSPQVMKTGNAPKLPMFALGGFSPRTNVAMILPQAKPFPIVYWNREKYMKMNQAERDFVLCHELAHINPSRKEPECDAWSVVKMRQMGYNPSQIYAAAANTLNFDKKRFSLATKKALHL